MSPANKIRQFAECRGNSAKKEFASGVLNPKTDVENEVENQTADTNCMGKPAGDVPQFEAMDRRACSSVATVRDKVVSAARPNGGAVRAAGDRPFPMQRAIAVFPPPPSAKVPPAVPPTIATSVKP